jgi:hypothetical protein
VLLLFFFKYYSFRNEATGENEASNENYASPVEFRILTRRVDAMESSIGNIVSKVELAKNKKCCQF